jgi:hypothetical protein
MFTFIWLHTTYAHIPELTPPPSFEKAVNGVCNALAAKNPDVMKIVHSPAIRHVSNLASRFGHVDFYASSLNAAVHTPQPGTAAAIGSSIWVGYVSSAKSFLDAVAIALNWSNELRLQARQQDLYRGPFRDRLRAANPAVGAIVDSKLDVIRDVVDWRDSGVHRVAPLLVPHWAGPLGGTEGPPDGLTTAEMPIRLPTKPDIGMGDLAANTPWMDPLDLHQKWRPHFDALLAVASEDIRRFVNEQS